ncbi:MAG: hypothetical protein JWO05_2779 [Gemmatimonadetes bacterium]|nr:hypothetical protein [Gemmatimonadota bacterium]
MTDISRHDGVTTLRRYILRAMYLANFAFLAMDVWPALLSPAKPVAPVIGVAFSFWAALSTLSLLGVRYPLKMLPVIFMQLFYKVTWLLTVAPALRAGGLWTPSAAELFKVMAIGAVVDLLVIPWPYVWANFVRTPGDAWRRAA